MLFTRLLIPAAVFLWANCNSLSSATGLEKPHVIIETDLGGDPDDEASMVRFLLYACDFHIDGIILTNPDTRKGISGKELFDRYLEAYQKVLPNLLKHRADYPSVAALRAVTMTAYRESGRNADPQDPAGMERLIEIAASKPPYRIWYQNWGTASSMRLAFEHLEKTQGVAGLTEFCRQFHISSQSQGCPSVGMRSKFDRGSMREAHRESGMVVVNHSGAGDSRFGRWYHQMGLVTQAAETSVKDDITTGHGPLGALYTTQKEGDTADFLYLIPTGLNDFLRPDQGNWAGRYGRVMGDAHVSDTLYYWPNQQDEWEGETTWQNTRKRWADAAQSDFLCRLDWCVTDFADANHPPKVILEGDATQEVLVKAASWGARIPLSAEGSTDPDEGDSLRYEWIHYPEAGSCEKVVQIKNPTSSVCEVMIPADVKPGDTIHVILSVTDDGSRKGKRIRDLTRHRRMILTVPQWLGQ